MRAAYHARGRRALTLMELMLVLALLVIAGSIVIPAITGAFSSTRLKRSGDAVIARWAEARARAAETGYPYLFTFTPDTGKYRLEPWTTGELAAAPGQPIQRAAHTDTTQSPESRKLLSESATIDSALPDGVTFAAGQLALHDAVRNERRVDSLQVSGAATSTPILFLPDGSSSTATVVLQNDANQFLRLTLRGLTGTARSSGVLTRDEMDKGAKIR